MIEIHDGLYRFDGFQLAIDIEIQKGRFCAVLGPSGAGKTTLLSVIAGFEKLQEGSLFLNGAAMNNAPPANRPVNMIFQHFNAFVHLNVRTNVGLGISPALHLDENKWQDVDNALQAVGIAHLAKRLPSEISGGERQRIALARMLVRNRPILLLDEAFAALDPGLRKDMLRLVKQLQMQQNLTVLMVTHQPEDAKYIADDVIFVEGGRVFPAQDLQSFFSSTDPAIVKYVGLPTPAATAAATAA